MTIELLTCRMKTNSKAIAVYQNSEGDMIGITAILEDGKVAAGHISGPRLTTALDPERHTQICAAIEAALS